MPKPNYTVTDYIRWMGDYTFEENPFSEADAIVLCAISYYDLYRHASDTSSTLGSLIAASPVDDPAFVKVLGGGEQVHAEFIRAIASSRTTCDVMTILDGDWILHFSASSALKKWRTRSI